MIGWFYMAEKIRKFGKNKKKVMFLFFSLVLVFCTTGMILTGKKNTVVVEINDDKIDVSYWAAVMQEKRSEILAKYPSGFREEEAVLALKQMALEECIQRQIILQLAKREGLIELTDYASLLDKMEQENQKRKKKNEAGEIVYGVQEYSQQTYFTYLFSNLVPELIIKLKEKELKVDEEELFNYYNNHPELKQETPESASIILWQIDENAFMKEEEQIEVLTKIQEQLKIQDNPDTIKENHLIKTDTIVSRGSRIISRSPRLEKEIFQLRDGEISQVFEDEGTYYLVYCRKHREKEELEFEEIKGNVEQIFLKEKFEQLIEQKKKTADIRINESLYNNTKVE